MLWAQEHPITSRYLPIVDALVAALLLSLAAPARAAESMSEIDLDTEQQFDRDTEQQFERPELEAPDALFGAPDPSASSHEDADALQRQIDVAPADDPALPERLHH